MTSSKMRSAPLSLVNCLSRLRKAKSGSITPMFPGTGSTITAAISAPNRSKAVSILSVLLKGSVRVCLARSDGTPGLPGIPKVATPEPADTRRLSA
jgi:hypothetical protein